MNTRKFVSFDLDSTLVDPTYTAFVWEIGIPQLYAENHHVSLSEATSRVISEYQKLGDGSLEWYDISYWFNYFELPGTWKEFMEEHRDKIELFPEVKGVLEDLAQSFHLIVISNAAREFVDLELEETKIATYFMRTFSTTSDFGQVKKTPECFETILKKMEANPSDTAHVGDHYEFDYLIPRRLGIRAYFLDRDGKEPEGRFTVRDLRDFALRIKNPLTFTDSVTGFGFLT
jgi:HAD superfamily hydrolase (TIGR01549 family)